MCDRHDVFACIARLLLGAAVLSLPGWAEELAAADTQDGSAAYRVGAAQVDITPDYPVRLSGFGFRREESEGVTHAIWAKALAVEPAGGEPAVLITCDNLGVPASMTAEVAARLKKAVGLKPERLTITATHTHTAPMLRGVAPTLFGRPIPDDHQQRIDRYTRELTDAFERVALAALEDRQPARLEWGRGRVAFAKNRRTPGGPVDHDLPVLVVKRPGGRVRAIYTNYACHCVTLSHNKIGGDWAGFAQDLIGRRFPGSVVLVSVGCGADQNPIPGVMRDRVDVAESQGLEIAEEVERLVSGRLKPVTGDLTIRRKTIPLKFAPPPSREELAQRAEKDDAPGYHARVQLARLDRGEPLQTHIDYPIQTWAFGDSLALVFLPGEVVVDYSLRLKRELDGGRLWITAYANDCPCYIPSERILQEGGYEGARAMTYYDRPGPFAPGLEQPIIDVVHEQIGGLFQTQAKETQNQTQSKQADDKKTADPQAIARRLLDDEVPRNERQALAAAHTGVAADVIAALAADMRPGTPEEYRRIPWMWRVSVAAGQENQAEPLRAILKVSLPESNEPLRDWQAVVVGGGVVGGVSKAGEWPLPRIREILKDDQPLSARWQSALKQAADMAENEDTPPPTRYDALRMIALDDWQLRKAQLAKYLKQGVHHELQMGAVSGLGDVDHPDVPGLLIQSMGHFNERNRALAVDALLRNEARTRALVAALESGAVSPEWLNAAHRERLRKIDEAALRERALKAIE